jgi:hypothetical protein
MDKVQKPSINNYNDLVKDEIDRACSTNVGDEEGI